MTEGFTSGSVVNPYRLRLSAGMHEHIENCWSKVKTLVRGEQPRTPDELGAALTGALSAVTRGDINGWF
jgi:hypothetical protein